MKIDNQTLWLFADAMAGCLSSGLPPSTALGLSGEGKRSKKLREVIRVARQRCDQGMAISDALEPGAFPHYFIPVVRAGEAGGRLVEAFELLRDYSRRVGLSVTLVRNTWLYPLVCIVFGWIIRTGIFLYFGRYAAAGHFVAGTFGGLALTVLAGWLLSKIKPLKRVLDTIRLLLPLVRETEMQLAIVLFFATFRLVYQAGGLGVLAMFDLALPAVRNTVIRRDLLKARAVLEQQGSFADAFGKLAILDGGFKGAITTGSASGRLDQGLASIVDEANARLEVTLNSFNFVFQRVVAFCVAMSIIETLFTLLM